MLGGVSVWVMKIVHKNPGMMGAPRRSSLQPFAIEYTEYTRATKMTIDKLAETVDFTGRNNL